MECYVTTGIPLIPLMVNEDMSARVYFSEAFGLINLLELITDISRCSNVGKHVYCEQSCFNQTQIQNQSNA